MFLCPLSSTGLAHSEHSRILELYVLSAEQMANAQYGVCCRRSNCQAGGTPERCTDKLRSALSPEGRTELSEAKRREDEHRERLWNLGLDPRSIRKRGLFHVAL